MGGDCHIVCDISGPSADSQVTKKRGWGRLGKLGRWVADKAFGALIAYAVGIGAVVLGFAVVAEESPKQVMVSLWQAVTVVVESKGAVEIKGLPTELLREALELYVEAE